ncbi:MAG: Asp-tRNA(Asn)/Glu-tRNA(Gln) amidotransferase subunit GatA [Bacteroidetes bacterium]|nr:MAG: Asp-tRNA(Asn)/Glu-tRNA(Gln) amidotransferase subunit GatA [Bacteroidota bacterium]
MKSYLTLDEIQSDLADGSISCIELVTHYLKCIREQQALHAFVEVFEEEALQKARETDQKLKQGSAGKLAGLVLGIKDVLCYEGHTVTASSRILQGFESLFTATAVQRLLAEDAIVIGRQSCDEFAMGSSNENSWYGPVRNPHHLNKVPGGSSGGSAAAVSAGLCHAALGSDTGGSVRQPASFCGIVGLKPTYGRVSRWGLIAYASSFDQVGPLARSVEDVARITQVMAGADGHDNTASPHPVDDYPSLLASATGQRYRIGYLREALESEGLDPEIRRFTQQYLQQLAAAGHEVKPVSFPLLEYVVPCYYVLTTAEASSNLSRFDGVRYGYRAPNVNDLETLYVKSRSLGFGEEVKKRIMLGTFVLSAGYYDAYYTQAMKVRRLIQQQTLELFKRCDFLLTPTTPTPAFDLGEKTSDPVAMFLADIFTVHANLAGIPAISLPLGSHSSQLPFGIQLMAPHFEEARLLAFSKQLMDVCLSK